MKFLLRCCHRKLSWRSADCKWETFHKRQDLQLDIIKEDGKKENGQNRLLTHVVRHRRVRSGASIPRIAAGRPLVWRREGEILRVVDHPRVRVGPEPVGEAVVGGKGVVRRRRDRSQRLALL